jgi:hypothetical protein
MRVKTVGNTKVFGDKEVLKVDGVTYVVVDQFETNDEDGNTQYKGIALEVASASEVEETIKQYKLDTIKVTTQSGKVFYGDAISRTDISDAIALAEELNQTSTEWKLAEEINGQKVVQVTLDELKEARLLALQAKSSIIGVA